MLFALSYFGESDLALALEEALDLVQKIFPVTFDRQERIIKTCKNVNVLNI
jgi:hypothetical protein